MAAEIKGARVFIGVGFVMFPKRGRSAGRFRPFPALV
jgi:hypothetical protein